MKRLANRAGLKSVARLLRDDPDRWEKLLRRWRGLGIDTNLLLILLDGARVERRIYENQLQAGSDSLITWKIREAKRALKQAAPLSTACSTSPPAIRPEAARTA